MDSELFPEEEEELHEDPEAEDALLKEKLGRAEPKSLYSLLNVPQDATTEEIQRAFRSIAPGLHPDKHSHQSKEAASVRFQEIQRAAEVLGEARTRALYDAGGEELLASGLQVGKRAKKPQEVRILLPAFLSRAYIAGPYLNSCAKNISKRSASRKLTASTL